MTGHHDRRRVQVEELAYGMWESAGRPQGSGLEFWLAAEREVESREYRVLSLDGGGVHALAYLPILARIEERLNAKVVESGQFRLLAGTSTGVIVAVGLKLGIKASELSDLYQELATGVFRKARLWNRLLFFQYHSEPLRERLAKEFASRRSGREPTWAEFALINPSVPLIVTLWSLTRGRATSLSTDLERNEVSDRILHDAKLSEIVTACCSAPVYFPPREFHRGNRQSEAYCDGGITGLNNPAVLGMAALRQWPGAEKKPVQVISLGTGRYEAQVPAQKIAKWLILKSVKNTISALMSSTASLMDRFYVALSSSVGVNAYFRVDPRSTELEALDDINELENIRLKFFRGLIDYRFFVGEPGKAEQGTLNGNKLDEILDRLGFPRGKTDIPTPPPAAVEPTAPKSGEADPGGGTAGRSRVDDPVPAVESGELHIPLYLRPGLLSFLFGAAAGLVFLAVQVAAAQFLRWKNTELTQRNNEISGKNTELTQRNDEISGKNTELTNVNTEVRKENRQLLTEQEILTEQVAKRRAAILDQRGQYALGDGDVSLAEMNFAKAFKLDNKSTYRERLLQARTVAGQIARTIDWRQSHEAIAASADGGVIAGVTTDNQLSVWDRDPTRAPFMARVVPNEGDGTISISVALSDDGKLVAAGTNRGALRVWRVGSDSPVFRKDGVGVKLLAFSPDGRYLAAVSGRHVSLWNWESSQVGDSFELEEDGHAIAFSVDHRLIAVGAGHKVVVRDIQTRYNRTIGDFKRTVTALAFAPDSGSVVAGTVFTFTPSEGNAAAEIRRIDAKNGQPIGLVGSVDGSVHDLAFDSSGRCLALVLRGWDSVSLQTGSMKTVDLWSVDDNQRIRAIADLSRDGGLRGQSRMERLSKDGRSAVVATDDGLIRKWDISSHSRYHQDFHYAEGPVAIAVRSHSGALAIGHRSSVEVRDVGKGRRDLVFSAGLPGGDRPGDGGTVNVVAFSPVDPVLAVGTSAGRVLMFDAGQGRLLPERFQVPLREGPVRALTFDPTGKLLLTGSRGELVQFAVGHEPHAHPGGYEGSGRLSALAATPDGLLLAVGWHFGITYHERTERKGEYKLRPQIGRPRYVEALASSVDSRWLAVGSNDGLFVVDLRDRASLTSKHLQQGEPVWAVAFSPTGRWMASASKGEISVWDTLTWARKFQVPTPEGPVRLIEFGMNDNILVYTLNFRNSVIVRVMEFDEVIAFYNEPPDRLLEGSARRTGISPDTVDPDR
jgi:WD40 repeat protein/patatin-like phospholipase/acyl hydrolase